MKPGDAARVLGTAAMYDYRTVGPLDVAAWFKVIGHLDLEDALEAVARHYADSTERIMPAHINRIARQIREERDRREEKSAPRALPSRFEDDINREVRMEQGAATVKQVLGPLLEHVARSRPELPSAMDQLRELTAGPSGDVVEGEVCR